MSSKDDNTTKLKGLLTHALQLLGNPKLGLPGPAFEFVLTITPVTNVDLLVKDDAGRHLLAWREDEYGVGWHIPGGIIRWGEAIQTRIDEVARIELGSTVKTTDQPSLVTQFINARGTFISMLFHCALTSDLADATLTLSLNESGAAPGQLHWFSDVPRALYPAHEEYRHLLAARSSRGAGRAGSHAMEQS